jgi:general secretion pathway protein B
MSFLLDALRKAESQKHLGDVPTIHGLDGLDFRRRHGWKTGIAILIVMPALLVMAWSAWQHRVAEVDATGSPPRPVLAVDESTGAVEVNVAEMEQSTLLPALPRNTAGSHVLKPERTPVEIFSGPGIETSGEAQAAGVPPGSEPMSAIHETGELANDAGPLQPPAQSIARETANVATPAAATASRDKEQGDYLPAEFSVISYWGLPEPIRKEITQPRISVLVFSARPVDRFILIDGKRFMEKDKVEPGLVVEEIRRDGAVFSYRHYRFLITQ